MSYFGEFRSGWRFLGAASIGLAAGYTINNYLNNIFVPPLMREFGWSKSSVALVGATAALSAIFQPIAGRLTDRFGVRPVAAVGVVAAPLVYILFSLMSGAFWQFFILNILLIAIVAAATGAVVYSRLIAQTFWRARGVALAIAVCAPSLAGAVIVPFLSTFIDAHGWRAGYLAAAACVAVGGGLALWLVPRGGVGRVVRPIAVSLPAAQEQPPLWRNRAFLIITMGMALCSLSIAFQTSQLKVAILGLGFDSASASAFISTYAIGVVFGRLLSGAALDTLPSWLVAAVALSLPGFGLLLLASGASSPFLVALAVLLLGLSLGAEGDIAGYLVTKFFDLSVYSTVLGFVVGAIAFASALGALGLGLALSLTGSFAPFLEISGAAAFIGGSLFWLLRNMPEADWHAVAEVEIATELA